MSKINFNRPKSAAKYAYHYKNIMQATENDINNLKAKNNLRAYISSKPNTLTLKDLTGKKNQISS